MRKILSVIITVFLLFLVILWLIPIIWIILSSFKTYAETIKIPVKILPESFLNFRNFYDLLGSLNFRSYYINNIIISAGILIPLLFFSSLAAYAFARISFPFKNFIFMSLFIALMIPIQVILVPRYLLMINFRWIDSFAGVIIPGIPSIFATFFIRQQIMTLPISLDESAIIDGANHGQIFFFIILPLCQSAILAVGIVGLVSTWNDFLWPLIVINDQNKYTLSIAVANLQGQHLTRDNHIMTSVLLASFPVIVIFIIAQKYFIKGIAISGLKE